MQKKKIQEVTPFGLTKMRFYFAIFVCLFLKPSVKLLLDMHCEIAPGKIVNHLECPG